MNRLRKWQVVLLVSGLVHCSTGNAQTVAKPADAPPMPVGRSPVDFFRRLIVASPAETDELLRGRTPEQKKLIKAKIDEYRLYPPPLREWRLKATELRWYLTRMMPLPADSREPLLQTVPPEDRPLVEARLRQWDRLPSAQQQELLNNELALRYVSRPNSAPAPDPSQLKGMSAADRAQLEKAIAQWQSMPVGRRQALAERFSQFFDLTKSEQNRTMELLTANEREQLLQTISKFDGMPPEERARCIRALRRFSGMTVDERLIFLQGADRWKSLSADDRQTWRKLVTQLPPLPPGAGNPPLPPGFKSGPPGAGKFALPVAKDLASTNR